MKGTCEALGVPRFTYDYWRRTKPDIRRALDDIRAPRQGEPWDGGFISFRKQFLGFDTYFHQREIIREIELAKPGEIRNHCDPNAISTFVEYLIDYGSADALFRIMR